MAKFICFIPFLLVHHAIHVAAYIDDGMMRKYSTSNLPFMPQSETLRPRIQHTAPNRPHTRVVPVAPPKQSEGSGRVESLTAFNVDAIIRAEYDAWSSRYGKTKEDGRFEIFRSNFMVQMEFNRKSGQFYLLNEYGDLTPEEYEEAMSKTSSTLDLKSVNDLNTKEVDAILEQVIGNNDVEASVVGGSQAAVNKGLLDWDEFSFAMDFEERDMTTEEDPRYRYNDNDDFGIVHDDAPAARRHHKIHSMGSSSASEAASPEIQTVRQHVARNSHKNPSQDMGYFPKKGAFADTVAPPSFASVSPMGSSVGKTKIF